MNATLLVKSELDHLDHVAIPVQDVGTAVDWYRAQFRCEVAYQDETWALLRFGNTRLALVTPGQHPAHLGFVSERAPELGPLKRHRDGTWSLYIEDRWL
jgi:catechol 2,3-dioxygenase-like lactoylglutathione lyase family enzyme